MLVDRCLKISVRAEVQRLLELETGGLDRYNVYEESVMRQMRAGTFTPTEPYCFLVLSKVEPTKTQLPFIAVDVEPISRAALELGNRNGRVGPIELNILGRSEGEALDLASYILDNLKVRFPIKNHGDTALRGYLPGATMAYMEVVTEPMISGPGELAEQLILEGVMFHWQIVRFAYQALL